MPNWTKEQIDAIEKDGTNIIVSAGAGSGKTAVLSERVLRKLKDGVNIDELLILTFTKAAAAEMKERIRKKISKEPSLKNQLDKIDNAYITTFDSYALSIVKKYNYLANVGKNISIIEQSIIDLKKDEIMDQIFEKKYEEKDLLFLKLIDDFCSKDDKEIKKYVIDINNKLDLIYEKEDYLKNYLEVYYSDDFINKRIKEYEELLVDKINIINEKIIELEEYADSEYYNKVRESLDELLISTNYQSIKQNINQLPTLPRSSDDSLKQIKEEISSNLKVLTNLTEYENIEEIKKSIYKTKDYVEIIIEIILEFTQLINKYKYDNDLFEFNDIAKMAINILKNNELVRNEIKESLNEILIDEYQDTNDLQDLFISYIENNNVYMVGDIKQSIYRFRNANPNLFKEKYDKYSELENGIKIDLNKNFRSREEVLSNINLIFDSIMDNKIGGADYRKTHRMIFGNNDYNEIGLMDHSNDVEIYNYNYDKKGIFKKEEIEIFIIANDIKNKVENKYQIFDKDNKIKRNINYSDIAILMDRSTNFDLYKKVFEYLNIPLTIYKDNTINDSVDLYIIKNIINLLLQKEYNEDFKYSFISVLRSYLFNEDDSRIFEYFVNSNYNESELMGIIRNIDYKYLTPKELLETIIKQFNFYEKMITVGNIDSHIVVLDFLIEMSDSLTKMGYNIEDFYNYLNKIIEKECNVNLPINQDEDGVKIMTIHKSKGLEYHLCYYSGLYAKFNISDLKEGFLYDSKYGIITPYFDKGIRNIIYKDLLKDKYIKEEISEKIRLFYVALTRAKEKMILVAPLDDKDINSNMIVSNNIRLKYMSFLDILNSIKDKINIYIKNIDIEKINMTKEYNFIKKNNYDKNIELVNETIAVNPIQIETNIIEEKHFSKENHKLKDKIELANIEFGKRIHNILQNIDFSNPNYSELSEYERNLVNKFINNDILKKAINIYKEYEFLYKVDDNEYHGIIDLLLEFEDEFKIVDYKLKNVKDDAYIKQLKGYKEYIEKITKKKVSIYLYSVIDSILEKIEA